MFFSFGGRRFGYHAPTFEQIYLCYSASSFGDSRLESGDKVILPQSALHRLTYLGVDYPMLFELRNSNDDDDAAAAQAPRTSHCGVLEFVADEGTVVMPDWMMQNMRLQEGDAVRVRSAKLPKGTYVKLQAHASAFLDVSNPKAVLEKTLRSFTCLTAGDTVMVSYNGRSYYIDIVETRPAAAVSIIDTDCEVDFAPPLDYKEPEKPQQPAAVAPASSSKAPAAGGGDDDNGDTGVKDEPKFKPFTGSGNRLDGKASKPQASEAPSADEARSAPSASNGKAKQQISAPASSGASSTSTRKKAGKLVFGSGASKDEEPVQKAPVKQAEEAPKKDEPKFQAFTGKSYSLK